MIRSLFLMALFGLMLAGCGSTPTAPVDRFYRLETKPLVLTGKLQSRQIAVQPFRAASLYAERPMVYGERPMVYGESKDARQLRQYHYHLWFYAPAQLVQEHLTASLGRAVNAQSALRLEGRIVRFDRLLADKESKALLALELQLFNANKLVSSKIYQAERGATDGSLAAHVIAVELALQAIYAEFLQDANAALPD